MACSGQRRADEDPFTAIDNAYRTRLRRQSGKQEVMISYLFYCGFQWLSPG